ncbi:nuclear transport factor 2 family protein [Sphingobacterium thalpophilum]|uniref:Nuclear transport factor 2 family protein n=1 Tax=Sphingobacterium thalpophilum TaxID=259 RepID=A0ABV4HGT8_9SPHI
MEIKSKKDQSIMKSTGEIIFNKLLMGLNDSAEAVISLFHPDVVVEFPYASSLGTTPKMNFEEWYNYLKGGLPSMPNIKYDNIRVYQVDERTYWTEVYGETRIPTTGQLYQQNWVMHFTLKDGLIDAYREYWDPYAVVKAFGNGDLEAVKAVFNTVEK